MLGVVVRPSASVGVDPRATKTILQQHEVLALLAGKTVIHVGGQPAPFAVAATHDAGLVVHLPGNAVSVHTHDFVLLGHALLHARRQLVLGTGLYMAAVAVEHVVVLVVGHPP